jgi:anaerobic magnesium-protoporphyrin IX monomethyl ester cyclase
MRIAVVGAELEENLPVRYIRAALVSEGHRVFQVDFNCPEEVESAARAVLAGAPDIVAMSMVFTARAREFMGLATRVRGLGYRGHIIVGGHFAALNAEALLRDAPAIDSVGLGEGEAIVSDLATHLHEPGRVSGLVWRTSDGQIVRNPVPAVSADLDRLPWPVRRCPPDSYLGLPIVNMLSSRGCSHSCAFCSIVAWHRFCGGPRHRVRRVDDVADEMAALYRDGIRIFNFHDDNFLLRDRAAARTRILALRDALAARKVGRLAFAIKARPDEVDEDRFSLLQSMGLFRVFLGVEAGTAESLRALGRGQTLDENERAIDVVNRLGLHMCFNLLLLNPDSTLEDMAANVAFLRRRPDNPMNFCRTEIYSGTPLERKLRREGRLLGDYFGYDYRIADARAELACTLMYDVFRPRNYGDCLHHKVMTVDYESTLLHHFYPHPVNHRMMARVKAFIRRANLNTCDYLDEVVARAAEGLDEARYQETVDGLCQRMRRDEARLAREASQLLGQLRSQAERMAARSSSEKRTTSVSRSRTAVAVAGLAASMSVAGYARADVVPDEVPVTAAPVKSKPPAVPQPKPSAPIKPDWHMVEMVPPEPTSPSPPPRRAPAVPPVPNAPNKADEAELRKRVASQVLKTAAPKLHQPVALRLQVTLDKKGRVTRVVVEAPKQHAKKIETAVRRLSFKAAGKAVEQMAGTPMDLSFTVDEVRAQLDEDDLSGPPRTYDAEQVPYKGRAGSHLNEEIP